MPTVGRVVLYTNLGDADGRFPAEQQAAIVTKLRTGTSVSLCILYETGMFFMQDVPFSAEFRRGYWSWPVIQKG